MGKAAVPKRSGGTLVPKRSGGTLGVRRVRPQAAKRASQAAVANPAWHTVSPVVLNVPITAAEGFMVSPGVDLGKVGSVRQAISAQGVVGDAAKALADIVAGSMPAGSPEAMAGVQQVATALGMGVAGLLPLLEPYMERIDPGAARLTRPTAA